MTRLDDTTEEVDRSDNSCAGQPRLQIPQILQAYGIDGDVSEIAQGWINDTYEVRAADRRRYILQRLHPIFDASVHLDIQAVTAHLQRRGVHTPTLLSTLDGSLWVEDAGVWRMLTFVEGRVLPNLESHAQLRDAGALVGRFHVALDDLEHEFVFRRALVHDLSAHLDRLAHALKAARTEPVPASIGSLAREILDAGRALPADPKLPNRVVHGDLKATNLVFAEEGLAASAVIDLDTLGRGDVATEMGDALRSWCNPVDEAAADSSFDIDRFEAALEGYAEPTRGWITTAEAQAFPAAVVRLAIELASRFCLDAIDDRYFGWDPTRFASRREHNLARARAQLGLARSASAQLSKLRSLVAKVFASSSRS